MFTAAMFAVKREHFLGLDPNGIKRYLKNTGWLFAGQAIQLLVGAYATILVARHLGRDDFGQLSFVLAVTTILALVTKLGLPGVVIRNIVKDPDASGGALGSYFLLTTIASFAAYLVMLAAVWMTGPDANSFGLFCLLGGLILVNPLQGFALFFEAKVRADLSVKASTAAVLLVASLKLFLVTQGADLIWFAGAVSLEILIIALMQYLYYRIEFGQLNAWHIRKDQAIRLLKDSWPMLVGSFAAILYMRTDQIMLGMMNSDSDVGIYSAAIKISTLFYIIPTLLARSLLPAIIRAKEGEVSGYYKRVQAFFDLNALLSYGVAIVLSLSSSYLVELLFGSDYAGASPVLAIHAWASIFTFLWIARGQYLIAENLLKFGMVCTSIGAVVNIGCNLFLIPEFGPKGAAIASLISHFVATILCCFFYRPTIQLGFRLLFALLPFCPLRKIHFTQQK